SLLGDLKRNTGGTATTNTKGVFGSGDDGETWDPVARAGDDAPGFSTGERFNSFKDPVNSSTDVGIAFIGGAKGGSVTNATDSAIWWKPEASPLVLVAREGAEPPSAPGARWTSFDSLALPGGSTGPIFLAK